MERKRETEHNDLLPKKGNPLNETVCYKIGGTVFEIETACGGSEPVSYTHLLPVGYPSEMARPYRPWHDVFRNMEDIAQEL